MQVDFPLHIAKHMQLLNRHVRNEKIISNNDIKQYSCFNVHVMANLSSFDEKCLLYPNPLSLCRLVGPLVMMHFEKK